MGLGFRVCGVLDFRVWGFRVLGLGLWCFFSGLVYSEELWALTRVLLPDAWVFLGAGVGKRIFHVIALQFPK